MRCRSLRRLWFMNTGARVHLMSPRSIAPFSKPTPSSARSSSPPFVSIVSSKNPPVRSKTRRGELGLHRVQLGDAFLVATALEWRLQPHPHDFHRDIFSNHALSK